MATNQKTEVASIKKTGQISIERAVKEYNDHYNDYLESGQSREKYVNMIMNSKKIEDAGYVVCGLEVHKETKSCLNPNHLMYYNHLIKKINYD